MTDENFMTLIVRSVDIPAPVVALHLVTKLTLPPFVFSTWVFGCFEWFLAVAIETTPTAVQGAHKQLRKSISFY